jgi:hypothetical protein
MFRLGTENPWFCSTTTDRDVDFCIWVLEADGLHVPPFEYHAGGDGSLRAAGLDGESWRAWVEGMIRLKDQHHYASQKYALQTANDATRLLLAKGGLPNEPQSEEGRHYIRTHQQEFLQLWQQARQAQPDLLVPKMIGPLEGWSGNPEVGKRLSELWEQYRSISSERFAWEKSLRTNNRGTTNLWQDLEPYHTRLDSLLIHFVAYSEEKEYLVPPRSVIMTIVNGHRDDEDFCARSVQAAEALVTLLSS